MRTNVRRRVNELCVCVSSQTLRCCMRALLMISEWVVKWVSENRWWSTYMNQQVGSFIVERFAWETWVTSFTSQLIPFHAPFILTIISSTYPFSWFSQEVGCWGNVTVSYTRVCLHVPRMQYAQPQKQTVVKWFFLLSFFFHIFRSDRVFVL